MRNFVITVNGKTYQVGVEEVGATASAIVKLLDEADSYYMFSFEADVKDLEEDFHKADYCKAKVYAITSEYDFIRKNLIKDGLFEQNKGIFTYKKFDGYFNFNYTGQSLDPIRITYKFDGNVFYESAESNFTVEHIYRRTNVIISPVELPTTGNTIEIKIRLMSMGTPITLKRSMCYIRVNGQLLFVPTSPDSQGYIFVNYTMENYGKYTIDVETVSVYPYSTSRNSTTFTWVKT